MSRYAFARRGFLRAVGASGGLAALLRNLESSAAGAAPPRRFFLIHHPVGTVRENWLCSAPGTDFQLSRILAPFAPFKPHMVILDGVDIVMRGVGGGHEQGQVTLMTGVTTRSLYYDDDAKAEGPSIDQIFLAGSPALRDTAIPSLQVACDERSDHSKTSDRTLSYAGAAQPMQPFLSPLLAYQRVFGTMLPGGLTPAGQRALSAARRRRKSVLDFGLRDLDRLRGIAPGSERPRLEAHEAAVRELERQLDRAVLDPATCRVPAAPPETPVFVTDPRFNGVGSIPARIDESDDVVHERIGKLHFAVIKAAFRCDLTRVVTFLWSPGTNHVSFAGLWPGDPAAIKMHHPVSHQGRSPEIIEYLTRVEQWYATRVSAFLTELRDNPEGNLLDHTLVPYVTEVAEAGHSTTNVPIVLFGGRGVRLDGGRFIRFTPNRSTNDLWTACAPVFGLDTLTRLGTPELNSKPLEGVFV